MTTNRTGRSTFSKKPCTLGENARPSWLLFQVTPAAYQSLNCLLDRASAGDQGLRLLDRHSRTLWLGWAEIRGR